MRQNIDELIASLKICVPRYSLPWTIDSDQLLEIIDRLEKAEDKNNYLLPIIERIVYSIFNCKVSLEDPEKTIEEIKLDLSRCGFYYGGISDDD